MTAADGCEAGPVPMALLAATVNVYGVPFVRPVTPHDSPAVVQVSPPGEEVTVYPVIGVPPSQAGACHDTEAEASPALAWTEVGAAGAVVFPMPDSSCTASDKSGVLR